MQTAVYTEKALGVNGVISKAESQYLATFQGVLMQDTEIGAVVGFGEQENELVTEGITETNFLGFVVRDEFINSCETPTETYKAGDTATVITKGSLYITAPADAKQGQYLDFTGGSIAFVDSKGANNFGGWRVGVGGKSGEVIEITTQF